MRPKMKLAKNLLPVDFWRQRFLPITVWPFDRWPAILWVPTSGAEARILFHLILAIYKESHGFKSWGQQKEFLSQNFQLCDRGWLLFLWNFWNLIDKVVICLLIVCTSRCRRIKNIFKKQHWLLLFGKFYDLFLSDSDQRKKCVFYFMLIEQSMKGIKIV